MFQKKFKNSPRKKSGKGLENIVEVADIPSKDCKTLKVIFNAKNYVMTDQ